MQDILYAFRMLKKRPGFTVVAVVTLARGIGANTAIFSVVNALLLKPLPFPAPHELVAVGATDTKQKNNDELRSLSYPDFFDFRDQNHTFGNIAVYRAYPFSLTGEETATSVIGTKMSAELFDVLGIKPVIGHAFHPRQDEEAGGGPGGMKVVISDDLLEGTHFGGDINVLGRTDQHLDGRTYSVIGVMPPNFQFPIQADAIEFYVTTAEDASTADGTKPMTQERGSSQPPGSRANEAGDFGGHAGANRI